MRFRLKWAMPASAQLGIVASVAMSSPQPAPKKPATMSPVAALCQLHSDPTYAAHRTHCRTKLMRSASPRFAAIATRHPRLGTVCFPLYGELLASIWPGVQHTLKGAGLEGHTICVISVSRPCVRRAALSSGNAVMKMKDVALARHADVRQQFKAVHCRHLYIRDHAGRVV
jgi:hypothetical protein